MDPVDHVLYTSHQVEFFCEAVAYLFADSLKFSIEFKNGIVEFLNGIYILKFEEIIVFQKFWYTES